MSEAGGEIANDDEVTLMAPSLPPYVSRARTENLWNGRRAPMLAFAERLASKAETAGIVAIGGIANSSGRRFVDSYSDVDLAVYLSIPAASGSSSARAFAAAHPEFIPTWLPAFQFFFPVADGRVEVNCRQLILEVEEGDSPWSIEKQEAYTTASEILYDPSGRVHNLIEGKCHPPSTAAITYLASQLPWYGWLNPERQLARGYPTAARMLLNEGLRILLSIHLVASSRHPSHLKWLAPISEDVPPLAGDLHARVDAILTCGPLETDLAAAIGASRELGNEVLATLRARNLVGRDPFEEISRFHDAERQLREWTAADEYMTRVGKRAERDDDVYGACNALLVSLQELDENELETSNSIAASIGRSNSG